MSDNRIQTIWRVNDEDLPVVFEGSDTVLHVLRDHRHTEVKSGCETGECGSCIVLLDGKPVNSCQVFAFTVASAEITTVSGIGTIHEPHIIQESLVEHAAVQCGFCTPGIVLCAYALLADNPRPSEAEIRTALDGNLCRCGGYSQIVKGIMAAAIRMIGNG